MEHQFSVETVNAALDELGLAFIGFDFFDYTGVDVFTINQETPSLNGPFKITKPESYFKTRPFVFWVQKLQ